MITHEFDLDMYPGGYKPVVRLSQYDEDFQLKITPFSSAGSFSIATGTTVAIRGTKPDGNGFSANTSLSSGVVTVSGDKQITAAAGRAVFELTFYNSSGKELNSVNFFADIERAALDKDTVISKSQTRELVQIEDNADEIIAAANEATTAKEGAVAAQTAAEASETAAKASGEAAQASANAAATSAENAAKSEKSAASASSDASAMALEAASSATRAKSWAVGTSSEETSGTDDTCAKYYAEQAASSAEKAAASETAAKESADSSATRAKSWAVGTSAEEASGTDETCAKYYAEQADASAAKVALSETAAGESAKAAAESAASAASSVDDVAAAVNEGTASIDKRTSDSLSAIISQETSSLQSVNAAGAAAVKSVKDTAAGASVHGTSTLDSGLTFYESSQSKVHCILLRGTLKSAIAAGGAVAELSAEPWDGYHEYLDSNGHRFGLTGTKLTAVTAIPSGAYINLSFAFMTE